MRGGRTPNPTTLRCRYFNARSLKTNASSRPKLSYFVNLLKSGAFDVVGVSETWLTRDFKSCLLLEGSCFDIFRRDREERVGGGVALFVLSSLAAKQVKVEGELELVCCDLTSPSACLRIACCYAPPDMPTDMLQKLSSAISNLCHNAPTTPNFCFSEISMHRE